MATTFATPPGAPVEPGKSTNRAFVMWDGVDHSKTFSGVIVATDAGAISCAGLSTSGDLVCTGTTTLGAAGLGATTTTSLTAVGAVILGLADNTTVINLRSPSQGTVGAAGAASAVPATPTGYVEVKIQGTAYVIPYFLKA